MGLWHAEVGQEQGGGRLLKFLGEADELTEITKSRLKLAKSPNYKPSYSGGV